MWGPGEYFSAEPNIALNYCNGGKTLLILAVIAGTDNIRGPGDMVIEKSRRQLPIATVTFGHVQGVKESKQWKKRVSGDGIKKECTEKLSYYEAMCKARLIEMVTKKTILAASDLYKDACVNGQPPPPWANEFAVCVRDEIREADDELVAALFPNLPPARSEESSKVTDASPHIRPKRSHSQTMSLSAKKELGSL